MFKYTKLGKQCSTPPYHLVKNLLPQVFSSGYFEELSASVEEERCVNWRVTKDQIRSSPTQCLHCQHLIPTEQDQVESFQCLPSNNSISSMLDTFMRIKFLATFSRTVTFEPFNPRRPKFLGSQNWKSLLKNLILPSESSFWKQGFPSTNRYCSVKLKGEKITLSFCKSFTPLQRASKSLILLLRMSNPSRYFNFCSPISELNTQSK